jgi:hypothetical protein
MNRFLNSLILHLKDTKGAVQEGFMIFAFKFNPVKIQSIVQFQNNNEILMKTLESMGYAEDSATMIV